MATTYTDTTVNNLIINQLTLDEYTTLENNSQINGNELYLITDDNTTINDYLTVDTTGATSGSASTINADTLNGQTASYYAAASALSTLMPKSGGTFTGDAVAYSTNRTTSGLRNIEVRTTSATGTLQSTNKIIMVRK